MGAGKSTLLHLLAGFESPTYGKVAFSGADVVQQVGVVFQVPHLLDELSVVENVMVQGLIAKKAYDECYDKASELLAKVGLAEKASQQPRSLSGGEQQRVAVVRALFSEPSFILADEPTAHLDGKTAELLLDLILSYKHAGLIMVSHDESSALKLDHMLYLTDGTLVEHAPLMANKQRHHVTEIG